jgi:hypothetical protein
MSYVNIYAPYTYHEPAFIVGDRKSLLKLRAALDEALEKSVATLKDIC